MLGTNRVELGSQTEGFQSKVISKFIFERDHSKVPCQVQISKGSNIKGSNIKGSNIKGSNIKDELLRKLSGGSPASANAIEAIAIYETKTNMARKSISQTEQQECKVAGNANNKRKNSMTAPRNLPNSTPVMRKEVPENTSRAENKRKQITLPKQSEPNQQPNKRQNTSKDYAAGHGEKKHYGGAKPLCPKCNYHHDGPCPPKCHRCNIVGHLVRNCRRPTNDNTTNNQRGTGTSQKVNCYECGNQGHTKEGMPPERKNQRAGSFRRQNLAWTVVKIRAILALAKKIVRIPSGSEILIVHGDGCSEGHRTRLNVISCTKVQKYLLKGSHVFLAHVTTKEIEDKSEKKRLEDVSIIQDFLKVFPEDLPSLPADSNNYIIATEIAVRQRLYKDSVSPPWERRSYIQEEGWIIPNSSRVECLLKNRPKDHVINALMVSEKTFRRLLQNSKVERISYKLELPEELSRVHNTFHVSNLKKCHADEPLAVPLDGLHLDDKLHFVEEPLEIVGREVKR
ncbi:hypothetical protein Tco_1491840 [Tanacetum coccineum]